jgi:hypothetical protein
VTIRKDWHPTYLHGIFLEFLREQTMQQAARMIPAAADGD